MNKKLRSIYTMTFISIIGCFSILLKLKCENEDMKIIIDLVVLLSGGIFGSAFVTLKIEQNMLEIEEQNKKYLKGEILNDIKNSLYSLIIQETYSINQLLQFHFVNKKWERKNLKKLTYQKSVHMVIDILTMINNDMCNNGNYSLAGNHDWIKISRQRENCSITKTINNYSSLRQCLNKFIDNKNIYIINKLAMPEDIEQIEYMIFLVNEIMKSNDYSLTIEYKNIFFQKIIVFSNMFSLDLDIVIRENTQLLIEDIN